MNSNLFPRLSHFKQFGLSPFISPRTTYWGERHADSQVTNQERERAQKLTNQFNRLHFCGVFVNLIRASSSLNEYCRNVTTSYLQMFILLHPK